MKLGWYIITKKFRGGSSKYRFKVTKKIMKKFNNDWDELFEYIGDNTGGGRSYGYSIEAKYTGKKAPYEIPLYFKEVKRIELFVGNRK